MSNLVIDLRLFDGEGAGAAPAAAEAVAPTEPQATQDPTPTGEATQTQPADLEADFETLIKGEYREQFNKRTQAIVDRRFKHANEVEQQLAQHKSLATVLGDHYAVDGSDIDALTRAIEDDTSMYEAEAMEKGISVEQLKLMKRYERENKELREAQQERERREKADQTYQGWFTQAEEFKQLYPSFDLEAEIRDPENGQAFINLLQSGVPLKAAFTALHNDEIMKGTIQYTAQQVAQKTMNSIAANSARPSEAGARGQAAASIKQYGDVNTMTDAQREELIRRAQRGERIAL